MLEDRIQFLTEDIQRITAERQAFIDEIDWLRKEVGEGRGGGIHFCFVVINPRMLSANRINFGL